MGRQTIFLALLLSLPACSRCSSLTNAPADAGNDAAPEVKVVDVDVLPPPAIWTFEAVRLGPTFSSVALPPGCSMRKPIVRAKVRPSSRFVAVPQSLATLVIADADMTDSPPRLVGVAAVQLNPSGPSSNPVALPWVEAGAMPRLGRASSGEWIAAYAEPSSGKLSEVFVFKEKSATALGEGDKFEALDLSCHENECAVLTTRLSQVSAAGADVWKGKPSEPVQSWKRVEVVPAAGDSDARPSCIARMDAAWTATDGVTGRGPVIALAEGTDLVFWGLGGDKREDKPRELGTVEAPNGIVDATFLGRPVAFVYAAPVDDEGCARQGGVMHLARVGADPIKIQAPAPPTNGTLRPLARGGLATYLAPMGCGMQRKVAYAVVLADDGTPVSQPMPVGDAASFAMTTQGEKVDLWIQRDEEVVWIRATCAAP